MNKLQQELVDELKKYKPAYLAEKSGLSDTYIRQVIKGNAVPTLTTACILADIVGLEFLLFDKE